MTAYADNFDRSGALGANWTVTRNAWDCNGSRARSTTTFAFSNAHHVGVLNDDQEASVKVYPSEIGAGYGGQGVGVRIGANGFSSGYFAIVHKVYGASPTYMRLTKNGSNGDQIDTEVSLGTVADGAVLKVRCLGTSVKGYLDGAEILSAVDSTHTSGKAGLGTFSNDAVLTFDDFLGEDVLTPFDRAFPIHVRESLQLERIFPLMALARRNFDRQFLFISDIDQFVRFTREFLFRSSARKEFDRKFLFHHAIPLQLNFDRAFSFRTLATRSFDRSFLYRFGFPPPPVEWNPESSLVDSWQAVDSADDQWVKEASLNDAWTKVP